MTYLCRVMPNPSTGLGCPETNSLFHMAGIEATLDMVSSIRYPGGFDWAILARTTKAMDLAKAYLGGLGWHVGETETVGE